MSDEEKKPKKQLETGRGGSGRKRITAVGLKDGGSAGGGGASEVFEQPQNPSASIRPTAIICEKDDTIRTGLRLMLAPVAEVIGEARDASEACEIILRLKPELVLIDFDLGSQTGLDVLKNLWGRAKPHKTLVATDTYHATKYYHQLCRAGANGFYMKRKGRKVLHDAVRELMDTGTSCDSEIARLVTQDLDTPIGGLTEREIAVLIRLDLRNKEIAEELAMKFTTVEKHVECILSKLLVPTRTGAALKAVQYGYELLPKMSPRDPATLQSQEYLQALVHARMEIDRAKNS